MTRTELILTAGLAGVTMALLGFAGEMDRKEAIRQQSLYCEMVETYKQTGGEYGWPEYNPEVKCDEK